MKKFNKILKPKTKREINKELKLLNPSRRFLICLKYELDFYKSSPLFFSNSHELKKWVQNFITNIPIGIKVNIKTFTDDICIAVEAWDLKINSGSVLTIKYNTNNT